MKLSRDVHFRKSMLRAIDKCRQGYGSMKTTTRQAGLRCIREFERINGITFDPFNSGHVDTVKGMGPFSVTFYRIRKIK